MSVMTLPTQAVAPVPAGRRPPRLAFVTDGDPADVTGWSGINYFMSRALTGAGAEVQPVFGFRRATPVGALVKKCWAQGVLRRYYEIARHPAVLRDYARQITARLAGGEADAVFATGTHLAADLRTPHPFYFWTDATVPALFALYPGYDKFWRVAYQEAVESEQRAVRHATAMFFSSDWAAESAIRDLGADPARVHVVPFGANLADEPAADAALATAAARPRDRLVLLFAGVDWKRKGGDKALAVAGALAANGHAVELHVLGVTPPGVQPGVTTNDNLTIRWHGRVSKATSAGRAQITALFAGAHFFLLPTIGDCTPLVFAEANAHAVPVVTHRLGGIPTMIRDEMNGRMFARESSPGEQAAWLAQSWRDEARYAALTRNARREYDRRLNWAQAGRAVLEIIGRSRPDAT